MEKETIKILRELFIPSAVIVATFSYLVACSLMKTNPTLSNFLAVLIFTAALNSFNNYFDIPEDMLSKPTRPLPSQKIRPWKSLIFASILLIVSVLASYENGLSFQIMIIWAILAVLYSVPPIRLKKMPILNTSLIATNYIILPWLLAWSQTNIIFPIGLIAILFIIAFGSVISKDFEDERADEIMKNRTIPVIFGTKRAALITKVMTIGGVLSLMVYLLTYSVTVSLLCLPALITYLYVSKNLEKRNGRKTLATEFMVGGALSLVPLLVI